MAIEQLLIDLGYLGSFFAGILSSVSIFLPTPGFIVIFILGGFLNPLIIGLLAGFGAALGELTGYIVGYGAGKLAEKKSKKTEEWLDKIDFYFKKYHPNAVLFVFAATPLPFDFAGMACGAINYSAKDFFIVTLAGKLVKYILLAYAGYFSVEWLASLFGVMI